MPDPLPLEVKLGRENTRLKLDNAQLRAMNQKLLRRGGGYDDFLGDLSEVLKADEGIDYVSTYKHKETPAYDPNHEEVVCLALSDFHLSEVVAPGDCNNINVYNSVICANRLWAVLESARSIIKRHQSMYKVASIWSPMLGDMISGSIHQELALTNDLPDTSAAVLASRLLYIFYQELAALGLSIEIDAVYGNHPRLSLKQYTKRTAQTNLDYLVYQVLEDRFEHNDQISLTAHTSQIALKKIYNWTILAEHGIAVSHGGEEALEGKLRKMFDDPMFRKATGNKGTSVDQVVIGNLHKLKFLSGTVVNGCLTGSSELTTAWRLQPIPASQALWGVSKSRVKTFQYAIDVTDIKSQRADNPMSAYTIQFLKKHGKS